MAVASFHRAGEDIRVGVVAVTLAGGQTVAVLVVVVADHTVAVGVDSVASLVGTGMHTWIRVVTFAVALHVPVPVEVFLFGRDLVVAVGVDSVAPLVGVGVDGGVLVVTVAVEIRVAVSVRVHGRVGGHGRNAHREGQQILRLGGGAPLAVEGPPIDAR